MKEFYEWFNKEVDTSNMTGDEAEEAEAASRNAWYAAKELYQPKWISVNDGLPDENKRYLTLSIGIEKDSCLRYRLLDVNMIKKLSEVTHYMEIPE